MRAQPGWLWEAASGSPISSTDTATCFVYGDPHYVTFDKRQIGFTGKCTYILAQPCNSTGKALSVSHSLGVKTAEHRGLCMAGPGWEQMGTRGHTEAKSSVWQML